MDNEDLRLKVAAEALGNAAREDADHTSRGFNEIYRQVTLGTTA